MKKYLIKIALFFSLMVAIDVAYGFVAEYLFAHAKGGDTGRLFYINQVQEENVLVFGSSRAMHHYDPRILEDSLAMSCYNCGKDGHGILTMYPILVNVTNRYSPKVIIYEVTPNFDLINEHDNDRYLSISRPFDKDKRVINLLNSIDNNSQLKMYSSLYKYNGWLMSMVGDNLRPSKSDIKGYRPGEGVINYVPNNENVKKPLLSEYDSLKLQYLQNIADLCKEKNIALFFAVSPQFMQEDDSVFDPLYDIANRNKIRVLNHYCDSAFSMTKEFFYDRTHMNHIGAEAYTAFFANEIKTIME